MKSWADVRNRANLWDLLDELPEIRTHSAAPVEAQMALANWRNAGNMAHIGLGKVLGSGNFSFVYELGSLAAKITRIISADAAQTGLSGRTNAGMNYSGSMDMAPLFADFCMSNSNTSSLPRTYGYARHGDCWLILTERLDRLPDSQRIRINGAQGDVDAISERVMRLFASLPQTVDQGGVHRRLANALDRVWAWALELNTVVPVYCDLHSANIMRRPLTEEQKASAAMLMTEPELIISDPLVCYRG